MNKETLQLLEESHNQTMEALRNLNTALKDLNADLKKSTKEIKEATEWFGYKCNLCRDTKEVYKTEESEEKIPCPDCQKAHYKEEADFSNSSSPTGEVE